MQSVKTVHEEQNRELQQSNNSDPGGLPECQTNAQFIVTDFAANEVH